MPRPPSRPPPADDEYQYPSAREVLAINVVRLRRRYRWTQDDLASVAGMSRSMIAQIESKARNVSIDNIEKLARAFNVSSSELMRKLR